MARLRLKKYDSEGVQGKGTWVKFTVPTGLEANSIRMQVEQTALSFRDEATNVIDSKKIQEAMGERIDPITRILLENAVKFWDSWNWVDDTDKPLSDLNEMTIEQMEEQLLDHELYFIAESFSDLVRLNRSKDKDAGGKLVSGR